MDGIYTHRIAIEIENMDENHVHIKVWHKRPDTEDRVAIYQGDKKDLEDKITSMIIERIDLEWHLGNVEEANWWQYSPECRDNDSNSDFINELSSAIYEALKWNLKKGEGTYVLTISWKPQEDHVMTDSSEGIDQRPWYRELESIKVEMIDDTQEITLDEE